MGNRLKMALLPMYIQLYDDSWPELRERVDAFHRTIIGEFEKRGLDVVSSPVCRVQAEFEAAMESFEREGADAVVTLHLAYSPSLESASALAATELPLIVLNTTPTYDFSPAQHPDEILYNHGIHGVQDMCNLLLRNGKRFLIESGHWEKSDVLDRVTACVRAARISKEMKRAKVGRIGEPFQGMGDFLVSEEVLGATIGIETISFDLHNDAELFEAVSDHQIDEEMEGDKRDYQWSSFDEEAYRRSIRDCLSLRHLIEAEGLTALTVNFMAITGRSALFTMPFLEASKAMSRGIGYAGEGDVLTAALVGALLSVYPDTSFTEMFCPDWDNDAIFLSHMGEMNVRVAANKPVLREKPFPFTDAGNPIVACGRFRGGEAVYVCLAPGADNAYTFILSRIQMLDVEGMDRMEDSIRGWFRPSLPTAQFLSSFSKHGGIHHGVIVYGDVIEVLERFGDIMGWHTVTIR
ncbi:L-arabinose isomerase family protein [Paenibacillus chungangensis]|uniref:L-arabinose isomerase n=1 Tax=Paenibacillus chungangensis TaxID=696535 RepID=A0ABW3HS52_9BACL